MPKRAKELTALAVSKLKVDGRYAVGGAPGLHLRITGNGAAKYWMLRAVVDGKRSDVGLGAYPAMSLAEARDAARDFRKQSRANPKLLAQRQAERASARIKSLSSISFKDCAEKYIESKQAEWRNPKHRKQWSATLETYAYPVLGSLNVADIDLGMVLRVVEPIWKTKTETASRLRGRIESILDWATVRSYRQGDNPARWKGHLEKLLPTPAKVKPVKHHEALPYSELGSFMADLQTRPGTAARALQFSILTVTRSSETRGAAWSEINLKAKIWTIPAERMKGKKEHRVPLCEEAISLLEALPKFDGSALLFPSPTSSTKPLTDVALAKILKQMNRGDITQHGFRSTFRDWAGEIATGHAREVIEHALAHQLKDKVEAAYQRGDHLAKRARLMAEWGKFCHSITSKN